MLNSATEHGVTEANAAPHTPSSRENLTTSAVLIAAMSVVGCFGAWCIAGLAGLAAVAFVMSAVLFLDTTVPTRILLRAYKAELLPADDSQMSSLVDVLAWRAGLPTRPELYSIPSLTMSAFACGSAASPAIAVSEGMLRRLSLRETAAVLAHEVAHIRNGDLTVFALADALARLSQILAYAAVGISVLNVVRGFGEEWLSWPFVALMYAAPLLTNLLQQRLGRGREFEADRTAVALTGDAESFAAALKRLDSFEPDATGTSLDDIRLPVPGRRIPLPSLLRAPPPASERIAQLNGESAVLSAAPSFEPLVIAEQPRVSLVGYGPGDMRPRIHWTGVWY